MNRLATMRQNAKIFNDSHRTPMNANTWVVGTAQSWCCSIFCDIVSSISLSPELLSISGG